MAQINIYSKEGVLKYTCEKLDYQGVFMGACHVSVSVKSAYPIPFAVGDYISYRGENYTLNYSPDTKKNSSSGTNIDSYTYDNIVFQSVQDETVRCKFRDFVLEDNTIHFTQLSIFTFYDDGSLFQVRDRVQANLDRLYTGDNKWTIEVSPGVTARDGTAVKDHTYSVSNMSVWDILAEMNTQQKVNFVRKGRTITIGAQEMLTDKTKWIFGYGDGNMLTSIETQTSETENVITRMHAYGNSTNMPYRYYNKLWTADDIAANSPISSMNMPRLCLPYFAKLAALSNHPDGSMEYSYYDNGFQITTQANAAYIYTKIWKNANTQITIGGSKVAAAYVSDVWIDSVRGIAKYDIKEDDVYFDTDSIENIYPSMKFMIGSNTVTGQDNTNDNGVAAKDGLIYAPDGSKALTFTVTIPNVGFSVFDEDVKTGETPQLSMTSGMCGSRNFDINHMDAIKDVNNNIIGYTLECKRTLDQSLNLYYPYNDYHIKSGDSFTFVNIFMSNSYVEAASSYMLGKALIYLSLHDTNTITIKPTVDNVLMAEQIADEGYYPVRDIIKEGLKLSIIDNDLSVNTSSGVTISSLTIKEGEGDIPEYEITLSDDKEADLAQRVVSEIKDYMTVAGGGINTSEIAAIVKLEGQNSFVSKLLDDVVNGNINFKQDITVDGRFSLGGTNSFTIEDMSTYKKIQTNTPLSINPSGSNVGIGTETPNYTLDVNGSGNFNNTLNIRSSNAGNYNEGIRIHKSSNGCNTIILCGADNTGDVGISVNSWSINNKSDNNFTIGRGESSGISGLLINTLGSVGIGTTAPSYKLDINGTMRAAGGARFDKGAIFLGQTTSPTGIGTYVANYTSDAYGARVLAYDGAAYKDLKLGAMPTSGVFGMSLMSNGDTRVGYNIGTSNFASRTTGWQVNAQGAADFRYIYADELRVQAFTADISQALAGSDYLTKSVSKLSANFVVPAVNSTVRIIVDDIEGMPATRCFSNNDYIRFRAFNRTSGLTIANVWGTVTLDTTFGANGFSNGTQAYTFTCTATSGAGLTVFKGSEVLDYGTSGSGMISRTTLDAMGSPYEQIATWVTDPSVGSNYTVHARLGNLGGIANCNGYGLYTDNGFFTGKIVIGDLTKNNNFLSFDQTNGLQIKLGGTSVATTTDINNIQIADRNLLQKSYLATIRATYNSTTHTWSGVITATGGKYWRWDLSSLMNEQYVGKITISFIAKSTVAGNIVVRATTYHESMKTIAITTSDAYYSVVIDADFLNHSGFGGFDFPDELRGSTVTIKEIMISKGGVALPYRPAIEDIESNINTAQTSANTALSNAASAQTSANNANTKIANIVSDNILSANEKGGERDRWNVIASEKSGIDTQATTYGITTEKTTYDTAFQALATYLNNGTAWTSGIPNWITDANLSVDTTVVGTTYRSKWQGYFDAKTALLNAIYAKAKVLADNAQGSASTALTNAATAQTTATNAATAATNAQNSANTANSAISDMTSDDKITAQEKQAMKTEWDSIVSEKTKNDTQADAFSVSRTTYDSAYSTLSTTIGTNLSDLTTTWDLGSGGGATLRAQFKAYYDARTDLLNAVSTKAKDLANNAVSTAASNAAALYVTQSTYSSDTTATNQEIQAKVSQTDFNALGTRVGTAESTITQHSTDIASKVSQTDYTGNTIASLINQTATTVTIAASKINLVGAVTITDLDKTSVTPSALGAISTDASNAPNSLKNSSVSIGSDGTLNNAGGGKVTIGGLGYTGALDATKGAPSGTYVGSTLAQTVESNAANALSNAAKAQSTADGKITTFYQASAPTTGMSEGDIWFDTDENNNIYIYKSKYNSWTVARDSGIAQAIDAASSAQTTANKKVETYFSTTQPTTTTVGDLWYNTSTSLLKRWDGSAWVTVSNGYTNTNQLTDGANLGGTAAWSGIVNIPSMLGTPSAVGLYLTATSMGYWNGTAFKTYMDNTGNFVTGDIASGGNGVSWNQATAAMVIRGDVYVTGGNALTGAYAKFTHIDGNGVYTGTLTAEQVNAVAISASSITTGTLAADRIEANSITFGKLVGTDITTLGNVTAGSFNIGSGKFVVDANGNTTTVNMTAVNATISGTLNGVSGTFNYLQAVGSNGKFWFNNHFDAMSIENEDFNHLGIKNTRMVRFYASDIRCRGSFGALCLNMARVHDTVIDYYVNGYTTSYVRFNLQSNGVGGYYIPLYPTSETGYSLAYGNATLDDVFGFPVDLLIFNNSANYQYEMLAGSVGKKVIAVNANNNNTVYLAINGDLNNWTLAGGIAQQFINIREFMTPSVSSSVHGGGWMLCGEYDNNLA